MIGFSAEEKGMHARISPLLFCCTGSMASSPCCHSTIVYFADKAQRNSCGAGFIFERCGIRKFAFPLDSITGGTRWDIVGLKSNIGFRIFPGHGSVFFNFLSALGLSLLREPRVIFSGMEARLHYFRGGKKLIIARLS